MGLQWDKLSPSAGFLNIHSMTCVSWNPHVHVVWGIDIHVVNLLTFRTILVPMRLAIGSSAIHAAWMRTCPTPFPAFLPHVLFCQDGSPRQDSFDVMCSSLLSWLYIFIYIMYLCMYVSIYLPIYLSIYLSICMNVM